MSGRLGTTLSTLIDRLKPKPIPDPAHMPARRTEAKDLGIQLGVSDLSESAFSDALEAVKASGVSTRDIRPLRFAPGGPIPVKPDGPFSLDSGNRKTTMLFKPSDPVAFDPIAVQEVIEKHRSIALTDGSTSPLVVVACSCRWSGPDHAEHLAEEIVGLARPVPEVVRETLAAAELRMFGVYVVDPVDGVRHGTFRKALWEVDR